MTYQTSLFDIVHVRENNPRSQAHLKAHRTFYKGQCYDILIQLMKGEELTTIKALYEYKSFGWKAPVLDFIRRKADLKEAGVKISQRTATDGSGIEIFFMTAEQIEKNRGFLK